MEGNVETKENLRINFELATEADIDMLLQIEQTAAGSRIYSAMLTADEWKQELQAGPVYLIKSGERIVGSIAYEKKSPDHVYISGLIVRPEFQGKRIGRMALEHVLNEYANVQRIDLVTHPENPALHLYESLGFKVEERKENYFGDGEPRLVLALTR